MMKQSTQINFRHTILRLYTTGSTKTIAKFTSSELYATRDWLANLSADTIPRHPFAISFSRSSGPGGQNVNKVSSKATIKLTASQWQSVDWVPTVAKVQLVDYSEDKPNKFPYTTKSGSLVVQSDRSRSRSENVQDCFEKLASSIKNHVYVESEPDEEAIKRWERIHDRKNKERLEKKKLASTKKQGRKMSKRDFE